jgi:hypothetical protein
MLGNLSEYCFEAYVNPYILIYGQDLSKDRVVPQALSSNRIVRGGNTFDLSCRRPLRAPSDEQDRRARERDRAPSGERLRSLKLEPPEGVFSSLG